MYLYTTGEEDQTIIDALNAQVGDTGPYFPGVFDCRYYSQTSFDAFASQMGYRGDPPQRDPSHSNPWTPSPQSLPFSSSTDSWPE